MIFSSTGMKLKELCQEITSGSIQILENQIIGAENLVGFLLVKLETDS